MLTWPNSRRGCRHTNKQVATASMRRMASVIPRPRLRSRQSETAESSTESAAAIVSSTTTVRPSCVPNVSRQSEIRRRWLTAALSACA